MAQKLDSGEDNLSMNKKNNRVNQKMTACMRKN